MGIEEPTLIGDTPEDKQRARERRKKLKIVAGVVVIIVAVAIGISLLPTRASTNVYVNSLQSSCKPGSTFSCTIVLDAKQGAMTVSQVRSVEINGTNTSPTMTATGGSVTIAVSLPSINMERGLPDVGASVHPPSVGSVVVFLSDGTTVSCLLGPAGVLP